MEILSGSLPQHHSAIKYYDRSDVAALALHFDTVAVAKSALDQVDLNYIFRDNNEFFKPLENTATYEPESGSEQHYYPKREKPILKYFYKTPANFFEIDKKHFFLKLNPIVDFSLGTERGDDELIFFNRRGVRLRGGIDQRIFFQTDILETQARFPFYVTYDAERRGRLVGAGFYKTYESRIFNITNGYDFLLAQGFAGFQISKHVGLRLGHGRHFVGNGYRSLILSDWSTNYFYLELNTRVWKFHYRNIFAELTSGFDNLRGDRLLPKKYMAAHHLSYNVFKNFSVGFFEAIIFNRENHFEFQYLNPVILYRTVEHLVGSPDNIMIGLDFKWNLWKRVQLYGQIMLDEFKFNELFIERNGWWANKFGLQAGLKYVNAFNVDHLDIQAEINIVRPYMYMHTDSSANYTHFKQPLAHPLGANFWEYLVKFRYVPVQKMTIEGRLIMANYGENDPDSNWGGDILLANASREMNYGNDIGQGVAVNSLSAILELSYQFKHNLYVDLFCRYRNKDADGPEDSGTTSIIGGGVRYNIASRKWDF